MVLRVWVPHRLDPQKKLIFLKLFLHVTFFFFSCLCILNFLEIFDPSDQFWPMKKVPTYLFATEIKFSKLIAQKKNLATPETFDSLKTLNFLSQVLKPLPAYVRTKILTVWTLIKHNENNFHKLWFYITFIIFS